MNASERNWITLGDVVKIKKLADNINFMRLFFLKSADEQINQLKMDKMAQLSQGCCFVTEGLEIIDCVLAILLFEIYRLFRAERVICSKNQIQFKILYFFSRLKLCQVFDPKVANIAQNKRRVINDDDDDDLCGLIQELQVEVECENCKMKTKENVKFKNLYKRLIEDIMQGVEI